MTEYYKKQLEDGLKFQDYCGVQFAKLGFALTSFSSKEFQIKKGENLQGFEFKFDKIFRKTNNLWIEVCERTRTNIDYTPSGINRSDNTRFYVMGDYEGVYLMQKSVLIFINEKETYKLRENNMKTSMGFLFPCKKAKKLFDYVPFEASNNAIEENQLSIFSK